jgi:uncharacterized Ntn-hydrolase superfamily protein
MKRFYLLLLCVVSFSYLTSQDTFSIVAVDPETGEVGSAGATCLDNDDIEGGALIISDVHPGVGAIHTQSFWRPENQAYARQLMEDGVPPADIIDSLVANDVQNNPGVRQYGIVDLFNGFSRSAAFTGENCLDYKNHVTGPTYAIQGNILLGQQILDSMEAGFLNTEGNIVCKLMAAMQGANVVGADTRCTSNGTSSLSAFLRVAKPDDHEDTLSIDFRVVKVFPGTEPIDMLQNMVNNWGGCIETSLDEGSNNGAIRVFPNPAEHNVTFDLSHLNLSQDIRVTIFDTRGRMAAEFSEPANGIVSWSTGDLPKGMYIYRIFQKGVAIENGKILVK